MIALERQFLKDMRRLRSREPLALVLTMGEAFTLLANLQLALRHPANRGPSARGIALEFALRVQRYLAATPAIAAACQAGWEPGRGVQVRRCRACGCVEDAACPDDGTGRPCSWAEPDLCTACARRAAGGVGPGEKASDGAAQ